MDLSNISKSVDTDQGAFLHLEHPATGEKLYADKDEQGNPIKPIGMYLVGMDSKVYRRKQAEIANRALAKKRKQVTYEQFDENGTELLAACVVSFQNMVVDEEVMEDPKKQAHPLFLNHRWIREQADEFIGDRRNFFMIA